LDAGKTEGGPVRVISEDEPMGPEAEASIHLFEQIPVSSLTDLVTGSGVPVWTPYPWPDTAGVADYRVVVMGGTRLNGYKLIGEARVLVAMATGQRSVPRLLVEGSSSEWQVALDGMAEVLNHRYEMWAREGEQGTATVIVFCPGTIVHLQGMDGLPSLLTIADTLTLAEADG
jgi:hypothetical protein